MSDISVPAVVVPTMAAQKAAEWYERARIWKARTTSSSAGGDTKADDVAKIEGLGDEVSSSLAECRRDDLADPEKDRDLAILLVRDWMSPR